MRPFITNIILLLLLHAAVFAQAPRAEWKLNTLHFHIADDESWCLEINGLPELTEYGAHHELPDWNLQETAALKPTCNGRIGYSTYYTAEEYQRILRYAWERRIRVVPEFDTPGHSRASIKTMQAYERRTGDDTYRLQDPADTSHYWSVQDFTDNVLSVYLPSVYTLYGMVFDEVIRLHREAGVPLPAIHIVGVEAALWSSQLRSFSDATYQMLPKGLGTAERAWNAYPNWPSEADFNADFERFYGIIMAIESARWEEKGYKSAMRR